MGEKLTFRTLRADEIDCRVGTCNERGFSLLTYKDARCDMNILDETIGTEKWQRRHYEVKGNLYCSVGIKCGNEWVWKDDCGTESNTEKEKGESSDSFKRACFNWGIGRELYTSPFIYVKGNTKDSGRKDKQGKPVFVPVYKSFDVTDIEYLDGRVIKLTIEATNEANIKEVIYEYGKKKEAASNKSSNAVNKEATQPMPTTLEEAKAYKTKGGKSFGELPDDYLQKIIDSQAKEESKEAARIILAARDKEMDDLKPIGEEWLPF